MNTEAGYIARLPHAAVLLAAALIALAQLRTVYLGDSLTSRLATVWALSEHGTWCIDRPLDQKPNPFAGTIDQVEVRGRRLSSKPPLLPLAMTGEYFLLNRVVGLELTELGDLKRIVQVLTLSLVILPYLVGLFFFGKTLELLIVPPWRRLYLFAAAAWGTQVTGFSGVFNNHVPAVAMLMISLYFAIGLSTRKHEAAPWRFAVFGLAGAAVFCLDLPAAVFVAVAGLVLLWYFPAKAVLWGGLGMAPLLIAHFAIMIAVTGSPLPVQMNYDVYLFESSLWREPGGADALNEPKLTYLFHLSFGRHGAFLLFPVLILGFIGAGTALLREKGRCRLLAFAGIAAFTALTWYYVTGTSNYGGAAYGFRWYMAAAPPLLLMAAPAVTRFKWRGWWCPLLLLLAVSMYSAWECGQAPWSSDAEWTCRLLFGPSF